MTDQEQQLILALADRVRNAPAPQIDPAADDLIRRTIGARPDALYLLVQTILMQEMALRQNQGSFLPGNQVQQPQYAPQYQQPQYAPQPSGGGMFSNFLHTAAGVMAGELAWDSLSSLFGGHRGGGGSGFFGGGNDAYIDPDSGSDPSQFASVADQNDDISSDIEDDRDV